MKTAKKRSCAQWFAYAANTEMHAFYNAHLQNLITTGFPDRNFKCAYYKECASLEANYTSLH